MQRCSLVLVAFVVFTTIATAATFESLSPRTTGDPQAFNEDCRRCLSQAFSKGICESSAPRYASGNKGYELLGAHDDFLRLFSVGRAMAREHYKGESAAQAIGAFLDHFSNINQNVLPLLCPDGEMNKRVTATAAVVLQERINALEAALLQRFGAANVCRDTRFSAAELAGFDITAERSGKTDYVVRTRVGSEEVCFTIYYDEIGFEAQSPPLCSEQASKQFSEQLYGLFADAGLKIMAGPTGRDNGGGHLHGDMTFFEQNPFALRNFYALCAGDPVLAALLFAKTKPIASNTSYTSPFYAEADHAKFSTFLGRFPHGTQTPPAVAMQIHWLRQEGFGGKYHGINIMHDTTVEVRRYPPMTTPQAQMQMISWYDKLFNRFASGDQPLLANRQGKLSLGSASWTPQIPATYLDGRLNLPMMDLKAREKMLCSFTRDFLGEPCESYADFIREQAKHL